MTRKLLILFLLTLLCPLGKEGLAKEREDTRVCSLIPNYSDSSAPFARKGTFRKGFRYAKKKQYKKAHSIFSRNYASLEARAKALFQGNQEEEISNQAIQKFLERHVLGPNPDLVSSHTNFHLIPEVALTWTHVQCMLGLSASEWAGIRTLELNAHPEVFQAKAISAWKQEDMLSLEQLIKDRGSASGRDVIRQVMESLWHTSSGRPERAMQSLESATNECLGPKECEWARWLRSYLEERNNAR